MPTFNSPPNWPTPPQGWTPPPDWKPDPAWGPAPHGWQLWLGDQPVAKKSWFARHKVLTGIGAVAAIAVVATAIGGGGDSDPVSAAEPGSSSAPANVAKTKDKAASTEKKAATTEKKAAATEKKAAATNTASAKIGDTVKDGSLTFKVSKVSCGQTKIGDSYVNKKAQGQFCVLSVKVKNVGDSSALFTDSNQKLINAKGQEFSADSEAAIYLDDSNAFLEEINPGNSVSGKIVFDIPKSEKPEIVELHDNRIFSGGARVTLS